MLVEHARNVMGMADAVHAEYGASGVPVVSALSCSLDGVDIDLRIRSGSLLEDLYGGARSARERTTCNYGLNPAYQEAIGRTGLSVSATDETTEARAVERREHPFFVATLYQPQLRSTAEQPHPVLSGFARAVARHVETLG